MYFLISLKSKLHISKREDCAIIKATNLYSDSYNK